MEGQSFEIPMRKLKKCYIMKYFDQKKRSLIKIATFKTSQDPVVFSADNLEKLVEHLKLHPESWLLFLDDLAEAMKLELLESVDIDPLKL